MAEEATKAQAAAKVEPQPAEIQTNCPACNKQIKKLKRYYRNGKFYCNKRCWRKVEKAKEEKNGQPAKS